MNPESATPVPPGDSPPAGLPGASPPVFAEQLLAYAEGSLSGEERWRIQEAICADVLRYEQMVELRQRIYERATFPTPPSLVDEVVALEAALAAATDTLSGEASLGWNEFREWCARISAEVVTTAELANQTVRALHPTAWVPAAVQLTRLASTRGAEPAVTLLPAEGEVHLERDGNSVRIRPTDTGVTITVILADDRADRVVILRPSAAEAAVLERFPGTQTGWPKDRVATLEVPCEPGPNRLVVEVSFGAQVLHRWACGVNRL